MALTQGTRHSSVAPPVNGVTVLRTLFSALVAGGFLLAAPAQSLTLECSIRQTAGGGGYVTETYILQHDPATGEAVVSDGLILHFNDDQPMQAKVSADTDKKLVLTWDVLMRNGSGQTTRMRFRAAYFRDTAAVTIRAVPAGYSNEFEDRGTCKPI